MKKTQLFLCLIACIAVLSAGAQNKSKAVVAEKKVAIQDVKSLNAIPHDLLPDALKNAMLRERETSTPMQGIVYSIISSTNTSFNDCFNCGPAVGYETSCMAKYTIETRQYTEYQGGQVKRVWMNTVSVFMGCGKW